MTALPVPKQTCADCVFFHRAEIGECHFDAPVIIELPDRGCYRSAWPAVRETEWCGRFEFNAAVLGLPNWPEVPVASAPMSVRALNCLDRAGISTFGDLAKWDCDNLLMVKHMGKTTVREINSHFRAISGTELQGIGRLDRQATPMDDYTAEDRSH